MSKYDDIINLERPLSKRSKMTIENRAAQFAPFSALTGYNEAIKEKARLTDKKRELTDGIKNIINEKLNYISEHIKSSLNITVEYFIKDSKKFGGKYVRITDIAKKIDNDKSVLCMENGTCIYFDDISDIGIDGFDD